MKKVKIYRLFMLTLAALVMAKKLHAVGSSAFANQIVGTKAFGMGNVFVATADDPSAIYFNPAGLTQLREPQLSLGAAVVFLESSYQPATGETIDMDAFTPIVPNLYFSSPARTRWAFGIGLNSPFGLETHWGNDSPLRYVATDSFLKLINLNPTIAYKWNDKISLGAGVVYGFTSATLKSRTNLTALNSAATPDGGKKLSGDGDAWGYNLGLLLQPHERHSVGISYRSALRAHVEGEVELSALQGAAQSIFGGETYTTAAETDLLFPQTVLLGYAYKPGRWVFEVDGEWANYSGIDETNISFTDEQNALRRSILNAGNPTPRDWRNTWNLGMGANYTFNETWQARGGYFHYPRVIPTATWDPLIPESSHNGYTIGGTFNRPAFSVDLAYNFIEFNERTVNNDVGATSLSTINGDYKTTAHIFSVNVTNRFGPNKND